jgi:hypothetical protein
VYGGVSQSVNGALENGGGIAWIYLRDKKTVSLVAARYLALEIAVCTAQGGIARSAAAIETDKDAVSPGVLVQRTAPYAVLNNRHRNPATAQVVDYAVIIAITGGERKCGRILLR